MVPLRMLAQAAIPVALISVGATMNWSALARLSRFTGHIAAVKLILLPGAVAATALALGVSGPLVVVLVIFAALPMASAAHVLVAGFDADRALAATLVAQTTLLSAVSLSIWIAVAEAVF
ncbi:MAG: hypothetical protein CSA70_08865 [Rhodobacterales bacterium]|nr:MAG: hypothetical protein CSA70_08865 [Rhodobacterales bacterium]